MAAPTSVRVEATSIATTLLNWVYPGLNAIGVFRSTDGIDYTEVTTTRVASGTTTYTDTGLATGTKYWYKLTEDETNFSSVVSVWTHACPGDSSENTDDPLPRFLEEVVDPEKLNELTRRVEDALSNVNVSPTDCIACPSDGAVVIDCSSGCSNWTVIADTDINSVSINWCNNYSGYVDFLVPPGATVGVCGFPAGFGFSGDECTQAPLSGGPNGSKFRVSYTGGGPSGGSTLTPGTTGTTSSNSNGPGRTSGGGAVAGAGGGCVCVSNGPLTIKSCRANNSLDCSNTKSLTLIACGGRAPYTWSRTGTVKLTGNGQVAGSSATGSTITVTPPANPAPATVGTAYTQVKEYTRCDNGGTCTDACAPINSVLWSSYDCNDAHVAASDGNTDYTADETGCGVGFTGTCVPGDCSCASCKATSGHCSGQRTYASSVTPNTLLPVTGGISCDKRTGPMIAAGCVPCGTTNGNVVTVTDSLGTSVSVTIRP